MRPTPSNQCKAIGMKSKGPPYIHHIHHIHHHNTSTMRKRYDCAKVSDSDRGGFVRFAGGFEERGGRTNV